MSNKNGGPKNLNLVSLIPERPTMTDLDGNQHEFLVMVDLSAKSLATITRLRNQFASIVDEVGEDDSIDSVAEHMDDTVNSIMEIILPGYPKHKIADIGLGMKSEIFVWWQKESGFSGNKPVGDGPAPETIESKMDSLAGDLGLVKVSDVNTGDDGQAKT